MALKKLEADLSIIAKLGTNPGVDDGLSEEQLKAKFDEAANIIKDYLNNYLLQEIGKTVDVESMLSDILDTTFSKSDKAANAKATGDVIRGMRTFFEKVIHSGDYVLDSDRSFAMERSGVSSIRIYGGEGVIQGNLFSLNVGSYEDVELEAGTYGLSRNDLVVIRCTKNEVGALSYALVPITGSKTSGNPVDPEYIKGDINKGAVSHDFPLYRVRFDGSSIAEVSPMFAAEKNIATQVRGYAEQKKLPFYNTVVSSDAFVEDTTYENYPFRASVSLPGVISRMIPEVIFGLEDAVDSNFAPVTMAYDGGVYIYAMGKPSGNITIPTILCWMEE